MPQDLFASQKTNTNYWDEESAPQQPVDLFELAKDPSTWEKVKSGLKQNFASIGNTMDTAGAMAAQGIGTLLGAGEDDQLFEDLNKRIKLRNEWAGTVDPGIVGKVAGALNPLTLPATIASIPFSAPSTGKEFIDQGESLGKAYAAMGLDSAGNVVGAALPLAKEGTKVVRALTGAGVNAGQDTAVRAAISSIADTKEARDLFAPTWETATVAAIPGGAAGVLLGKNKAKTTKPGKDIKGIVAAEAAGDTPNGYKAGEFAAPIDKDLWHTNQAHNYAREQAEAFATKYEAEQQARLNAENEAKNAATRAQNNKDREAIMARQAEEQESAQRQVEAERFVDENTVRQDQTGLSTGERAVGSGKPIERTAGDSGLMGLPARPVEPPVGLSTGENTPGSGLGPQRPMGPSNLMGEPVPGPVGLSTGEGKPGGGNVSRAPTTDSGLMGKQAPTPFDPFGSAGSAAPLRKAPPTRSGRAGPPGKGISGGSAPMLMDLAQGIVDLGSGIKAMFTGVREEGPDTITIPRSAKNIVAKQEKRAKGRAVGIKGSVYENITTHEEALANLPAKDIGSMQDLASGNEAVIRRNTTNGPLKYVRWLRTKAQTNTDALTAKYITGPGGFNETFRKMSSGEKMEVHQVIQELSQQRVDYSDALADKLGLSPAQRAFMESRGKALKAVLETANTVNKGLGFELIKALPGYSPGMFASTYVSLVGRYEGEGVKKRWITEAVVNANSKWEYEQGLKHYKAQGKEFVSLDRRGLNTATKGGRNFDGTMKLLAALAEKDSRFAEAKDVLDSFIKDQSKKLYNFDVHELRKKGVEGNIGNKPWLDAERNAKEGLEAEVNYIDEAFKYWNYQDVLNKTKQLVDDPKMEPLPNTRKYLDKYIKQVTGNNLHPIGAGVNSVVDMVFQGIGTGAAKLGLNIPENPNRIFAGAREMGSALMMNIYAPAFASIQLFQMLQSGIPESMKIRNEMGLSADAPVTSLAKSGTMRAWFASMNMMGKLDEVPDSPMKEAYVWMREHGIDHYNEIQMSHEAAQNPTWTKVKNAAFWPTRIPEMLTRPTVFMWYADMFHQAGLRGEELHYTAKNATDYAMVNYHTDERPMVYQQLGVVGQSVGALRTFVHNSAEQMVSRTKEMKQNPGAFLAMLGFTAGVMGVAGLPFYDEIDQWFIQPITKRSGRDWMDTALHPALINGMASQYTGIDLQSRFSMADMLPGSPVEALAGPQLARMWQILDSGFGYIKNQDTQSFNELAKAALPAGAYGAYEEANLVQEGINEKGEPVGFVLNKEGERKYSQGRSEKERNVRKVLGLRPLRERLEDEDLYTTKKLEKKMTDKQKEVYGRMRAAQNLGDADGFNGAMNKYLDLDGDPKAIDQLIKRNAKERNLSERQRQILAPGNSVGSVKKYERYWEN